MASEALQSAAAALKRSDAEGLGSTLVRARLEESKRLYHQASSLAAIDAHKDEATLGLIKANVQLCRNVLDEQITRGNVVSVAFPARRDALTVNALRTTFVNWSASSSPS